MKISIVTIVKNNKDGIANAIASINSQTFKNIQHVIIDGMSSDGTWDVIVKNSHDNLVAVRENDSGIYEALNKGINLCSGEIIGILHSDDRFYDGNVLCDVIKRFEKEVVDVVYGDLIYVSKNSSNKVVRKWNAKKFNIKKLKMGWMPPHPTVFISAKLFQKIGLYDPRFKISSDYKMLINIFKSENIAWAYIPRPLVIMRLGGASNKNLNSIFLKIKEDYQILKESEIGGIYTLILKNLTKIPQFVSALFIK